MEQKAELSEIAKLFIKLGIIGFGGPAAHIAMMQKEVVHKKKWLSEQHFLDLISATNIIPGPNSTEMAIHIGREKAGWQGLLIAGLCFIVPAVIITLVFAWIYADYGTLPHIQPYIYGIKPAIIAVILAAIFPLAKKCLQTTEHRLIAIIVLLGSLLNVSEIYLLFGSGLYAAAKTYIRIRRGQFLSFLPLFLIQNSPSLVMSTMNLQLFWIFLKVGSILYGSGYVLFAFLDTELVMTGMLSRQQLLDAIAVGQFTPGPVFSAVSFIGYQINGMSGALISTIAIFLPSFLFVALLNPLVKKMRSSSVFSAFLDAANIASIALILSVCLSMGKEAVTDWRTMVIAFLSIFVVFTFKNINTVFVVLGAAIIGYLFTLIQL